MVSRGSQLITAVDIPPFFPKINYRDSIFMAGSCFTEHIEQKLHRYKYNVLGNPFGILYNPVSIANSFHRIVENKLYVVDDLVLHDGLYHSMDHHGSFSGTNPEEVIHKLNDSIRTANAHLAKSKFVFVSPGTSRIYRYKETGRVAGNNHKLPHSHFDPHAMTVDECLKEFVQISQSIRQISKEALIIWTVSPVRHLKDGLVENQRSKAALLLSIEKVIGKFDHTGYFPAYEIMMDQLRDYRFYARDLTHPSDLAIDIIWDIFGQTYLDQHETEHHPDVDKIIRAREHRFIHNHKAAIQSFAESQLRNIDHLAALFPDMDWKEERQYFFQLIEPD